MKHLESSLVKQFKNPLDIMNHLKDAEFCICILLQSFFAFIINRKHLAVPCHHAKFRYFAGDHALKHFNLTDMTTNPDCDVEYILERPDDGLM